jgi:alkanesulfonate monooxygenase SsuD/methylene tetrahydromethanopterin reductase-like flavin-dependent oxidoreductase (luciferase family)
MRFGVFLLAGRFPGQTDAEALGRATDAVGWAEEAGFDDVWIAEHHFMSYGVCPSAITFAAHALARTARITVGTAVSVLSTAHPVQLAEQARMLTAMSGGRFHLGVGRGGPWRDLEVFGTGRYRWERGFGDGMRLLMDSLTKDTVGSTGRFAFRDVPMVPQAPPTPVTVACTSPGTVELAAELGLPMLLGMDLSPVGKAGMISHYVAAGGTATGHIGAVLAHVGPAEEVRATMPGWLGPGLAGYVPVDARPRRRVDPVAYMEKLISMHPVGGPELCVRRLREAGTDHVILMVDPTGQPSVTRRTIRRLGAEVLPALRGTPVT